MPVIDMGMDFAGAQKEAEAAMSPAPAGTYQVQIKKYEIGTNKNGGPKITVTVGIVNASNPDVNGKTMRYTSNLPNQGDMKGVGFLIQLLTALKLTWDGRQFDPDSMMGRTCNANISVSEDGKWNNIESFV